jgi:hypothetical protein
MSAHWVELWSPGLQAVGGVVELIGAGLLAYEWWSESGIYPSLSGTGQRTLYVGFILIVVGVIFQISANAFEWAGAYGFFGVTPPPSIPAIFLPG